MPNIKLSKKQRKRLNMQIKHGNNINDIPEEYREEFRKARRKDHRNFKNERGEWVLYPPEMPEFK